MSSVTKSHLSVDTIFNLFSFLSDRYGSIPNDSDKSDKRSQRQKRQRLRDSDKSKTPMTKGVAIRFSILKRGFCHCVFCRVARLYRPSTKAFRLLSLLSCHWRGESHGGESIVGMMSRLCRSIAPGVGGSFPGSFPAGRNDRVNPVFASLAKGAI